MKKSFRDGIEPPTLGALLFRSTERSPEQPCVTWHDGSSEVTYSKSAFEDQVLRIARWYASIHLSPGDRIAILSENRPEWHIVDFAAHVEGLVSVPVYSTLSDEQTRFILNHSGAKVVFCGRNKASRIEEMKPVLRDLRYVIAFDEGFAGLAATGPDLDANVRNDLRTRAEAWDPDSLATIVYTSGTTGQPKGAMLTHRNILSNIFAAIDRLPRESADRALSVLPLAHIFERMICYSYFYEGVPIAYGDPHALKELLRKYRPRIMAAVPRMFEKIQDSIQTEIAALPEPRRKLAYFLIRAGYDRLDGAKTLRSLLQPLAERLVFRRIRNQLGDVQTFVSGGAWLNPELERFFRVVGFRVLQGYGLTETSPVIACNALGHERIGTVGQVIEGVQVRIDEGGEILVKGPNVTKGYFRDPQATSDAFRDGWFVTGDLGRLDPGGYLVITGRRKEMLLLSNGKNVYYPPIEHALHRSPYIEQALILGEGRNYVGAAILPDMVNLRHFATERGISYKSDEEMLEAEHIQTLVQSEIESLTADFAQFERPKRFCFISADVLLDPDLVTPTLKIRPGLFEKRYTKLVDLFYSGHTCSFVGANPRAARPETP